MKPYFQNNAMRLKKFQEILLTWVGTPYMHMADLKGRGVDCTKFIGLTLTELGVFSGITKGNYYPPDWNIHGSQEIVLESFQDHVDRYIFPEYKIIYSRFYGQELLSGDCLGFSLIGKLTNHTVWLYDETHIFHSFNKVGVHKTSFSRSWKNRLKCFWRIYDT